MMRRHLIGWLIVVATAAPAGAQWPSPEGPVNDFASILPPEAEASVESVIAQLADETSARLVVVTVPSLDGLTVEEYAVELFNRWGIGQENEDNGVLVLVAPADRAMRIEVGYGLEPVLPDGLAGNIIRTAFLPAFREGDYPRGIIDGVSRIAAVVRAGPGQTPASPPTDDTPPAWALIPFLGLFVAAGAFAIGAAIRSRTVFLLMWGTLFGGIPLAMAALAFPVAAAATLGPLAIGMGSAGFMLVKRKRWMASLRGSSRSGGSGWTMGSGGSSGGGSSGSSFGGGSSGGGGASGRW